ncbi:MAG: hypothetical protein V1645_04655 [archaeon]
MTTTNGNKFLEIDLEEIFSVERKLSRSKVEHFKRKGLERLMKHIQIVIPPTQNYAYCSQNIVELGDKCHRCRALYDLGVRKIVVEDHGEGRISPYPPTKLKDAPLLNNKEYKKWLKEYEDTIIDFYTGKKYPLMIRE